MCEQLQKVAEMARKPHVMIRWSRWSQGRIRGYSVPGSSLRLIEELAKT